jgi:hypothetical protein
MRILGIDLDPLTPAEQRDRANSLLRAAWSAALPETRILPPRAACRGRRDRDWRRRVIEPPGTGEDRLICLSDAVCLVPFSETTLRRAIVSGELEAWQPNGNGKLVMWRSSLIMWATRRPAQDRPACDAPRDRRPASPRRRRTVGATETPEPIALPDLT